MGEEKYALLHVFLPCHYGLLPNLETHLRRLVIHETAKCGREGASDVLLGLGLSAHLSAIGAATVALRWWR